MQFRFNPMNESDAHLIANWHYGGIYAFYDMDQDLEELLDPYNWVDTYYTVTNEDDELFGYFCFEKADDAVIVGLGMKPDYTGKGLGLQFLESGLEFAKRKFNPSRYRLSVATFNQRAIKVYEKAGFKPDGTFMHETNGGQYEFLRMMLEA